MTLPYPIPTEKPYPSSVGAGTGFTQGWAVWAVQRALNRFHESWNDVEDRPAIPDLVDEDYQWDSSCTDAVQLVQRLFRLREDGVAGMATQRRLVQYFCGDIHWLEPSGVVYASRYGRLPDNLLHSISYGEAVYWLGITNWNNAEGTNVDVGCFQDNLTGDALKSLDRVQRGFDVRQQVGQKARELIDWYDANHDRRGCSPREVASTTWPERTWRRACMAHNRPLDAAVLARFTTDELDSEACRAFEKQYVGLPNWDPDPWNEPLRWVLARQCTVPGTTHRVETRLDWCRFYALGFPTLPSRENPWRGLVCRYVSNWAAQL